MNQNVENFLISLNYLCKKHSINLLAWHGDDRTRILLIEEEDNELVDNLTFHEDKKNGNYIA